MSEKDSDEEENLKIEAKNSSSHSIDLSMRKAAYEDVILNEYRNILRSKDNERIELKAKIADIETKYLTIIQKLNTDREDEHIKNDAKLEREKLELKKERDEERNRFLKERDEERNRFLKEREEEKLMMKDLETKYEDRIRKLETEREEEKIKNDLKLEKEKAELNKKRDDEKLEMKIELERERTHILKLEANLLKLEAKLEYKDHQFEKERKEHKKEKDEILNRGLISPVKSVTVKRNLEGESPNSEDGDEAERGENDVDPNSLPQGSNWNTFAKNAAELKLKSFGVSLLLSFFAFLLIGLLVEKNVGFLHFIANTTNTNLFFLTFVTVRIFWSFANYFLVAKGIIDLEEIFAVSFEIIFWVLFSILCRIVFPFLTGKQFDNTGKEIAAQANEKVCLYLLLITFNYMSMLLSRTFTNSLCLYFIPNWLPNEIKADDKMRNILSIFLRSAKIELMSTLFTWFLFMMIVLIGSASNLNLSPNAEILIFGYFFPIVKASVVSLCNFMVVWWSEKAGWSQEYTSKCASAFSCAGVTICTLSQLYVVFRQAGDHSLFIYSYVPHELIKKLSWLTFHPMYLKTKMQIVHIVSGVYYSMCKKKKDRVDPEEGKPRRFTLIVLKGLNATAGEINGRQFGEDCCMVVITLMMLPIMQEYLFQQIYQTTSDPLPFPTYQDIGVIICGVGHTLETILTILCYVLLMRVGIPLQSNAQILEVHLQSYLFYISAYSCFLLVLVATVVY